MVGDSSKYFPLWLDTVLLLHARLGYGEGLNGKQLPLGERFYVGGINTVRGFGFGRAGPMTNGEIVGANTEIIFNVEYIFPLLPERVKGVVFFDAGRGYNNEIQNLPGSTISPDSITLGSLKTSVGIGLRFILPIGPIRLEWGYNLHQQPGEKPSELEVSIGTVF